MADVLGCAISRVSIHETATFGAAILAGCGAHIYEDPRKSAQQLVTPYAAEQPNPERHRRYLQYFNLFKQLYESLRDCYDSAQDLE
jgi:xylulokinase